MIEIKRQILTDENICCNDGGYLSFDLGYKHMTAAYTLDFEHFDIFLFDMDSGAKFQDRIKQLKLNLKEIICIIGKNKPPTDKHNISEVSSLNITPIDIENGNGGNDDGKNSGNNGNDDMFVSGKNKIKCVIIEEQVQTNIQALNLMYAIGMYFDMCNIYYCIQPARLKYKFFEDRDKRQFKNLSAQYLGERLDKIKLKYQNYDVKPFQNHRWMEDNLRQWLKDNKIDKADDIGDVILLLKYYGENMEKIQQQKEKQIKKQKIK